MSRFGTVFSALMSLTAAGLAPQAAAALTPEQFGYVCQDAGAGGYEAFPDVCRLQDGRLMAVFYAGWEHVSLPTEAQPTGGRIAACYSGDEGTTWTPAQIIYDGPDDDRDPSIVQLKNGTLLCTYFSLRKSETRPYEGLGSWLIASKDGGKTWSEPRIISPTYYVSSPVRELADGALILGLYRETGEDANGAVTRSLDGGATWSAPIDIDNGGLRLDAETDVIALKDGRLYAAQRTQKESMRFSISKNMGLTWSVSAPMGFPGHAPYLYRAPSGVIACAHRLPNTSLHYSADECTTWQGPVAIDEVNGAYVSMVTLKDDTTLVVYYEEGAGSSIRARKCRITAGGVEWLPFAAPAPAVAP
jgi:Neuraminidase (sialidase)